LGAKFDKNIPLKLKFFSSQKLQIKKFSISSQHTILLTSCGKIYCFGNNKRGSCTSFVDEEREFVFPSLLNFPYKNIENVFSVGQASLIILNKKK
jgi:alpha-tubulin suppressor-like RCC1 family protein